MTEICKNLGHGDNCNLNSYNRLRVTIVTQHDMQTSRSRYWSMPRETNQSFLTDAPRFYRRELGDLITQK